MHSTRIRYGLILAGGLLALSSACAAPRTAPPPAPEALQFFDFQGRANWRSCANLGQGAKRPPVTESIGPLGGAIRLSGPGNSGRREHLLLVHPGLQQTHQFTMEELSGTRMGVTITADPEITEESGFSAILVLDAAECGKTHQPFLIAEEVNGVPQSRKSVYSLAADLAWAHLSDLSLYALAVP